MQEKAADTIMTAHEHDIHHQRTVDSAQPALPITHRRFANPAPLGLFAFATSLMLISLFGVGARGATVPNVIFGTMIFFGGICQYISGIMEYVSGNTVSITVQSQEHSFSLYLTHHPLMQ